MKSRGIAVDTKAFDVAMDRQKEEARKAWKGSGEAATETIWFEIRERAGATEFLGYDTERRRGRDPRHRRGGKEIKSLGKGEEGQIVVNQTPFYGESGGQVGDTGTHQGTQGRRCSASPIRRRSSAICSSIPASSRPAPSSPAMPWS